MSKWSERRAKRKARQELLNDARAWHDDRWRVGQQKAEAKQKEWADNSGQGYSNLPASIKYAPEVRIEVISSQVDSNHKTRRRQSTVTRNALGKATRHMKRSMNHPYEDPDRVQKKRKISGAR